MADARIKNHRPRPNVASRRKSNLIPVFMVLVLSVGAALGIWLFSQPSVQQAQWKGDALDHISSFKEVTVNDTANVPLEQGELIKVPDGLGDIDTFEAWSFITDRTSPEYKLRIQSGQDYDNEGFGKINGRYVVAVRPVFGEVGDFVTFSFKDGSTIECIIGDLKDDDGEAPNTWGHLDGRNILEFLVNKGDWYGHKDNPGTAKNHPEWGQCIVECRNLGNFWGH